VLTAVGALLVLDISVGMALLFGAIVASTDAAAVFSLIKSTGLELRQRIAATLEIESGVNDPMAVFLTIAAITYLTTTVGADPAPIGTGAVAGLVGSMLLQAGLGILFGFAGAIAFVRMTAALSIDSFHNHGLNALLVISAGMAIFGLSTWLGGSGFLSVYLFGVVTRQRMQKFVRTIVPALDGLAWLFQASMFLLLGLLATPADVVEFAFPGIVLALWLIVVARPLAVLPCLAPFGFTLRESLFIAWVGLRGAVPIVLAVYPIMAGVDAPRLMLNLAFMIVLTSLLIQGSTLALAARRLGVGSDGAAMNGDPSRPG
jgi:cell volume regulation protein A